MFTNANYGVQCLAVSLTKLHQKEVLPKGRRCSTIYNFPAFNPTNRKDNPKSENCWFIPHSSNNNCYTLWVMEHGENDVEPIGNGSKWCDHEISES